MTEMTRIPDFHDPERAGDPAFTPDVPAIQAAADALREQGGARLYGDTARGLELLVIDNQKDFAAYGGALYVGGRAGDGAPRDSARLAEFIYRNLNTIERVTPTLDTHHPTQIFFPGFWIDPDGNRPAPLSTITADDLRRGRWRPDPAARAVVPAGDHDLPPEAWARRQALHYAEQLEASGRYALTIWPYHCLAGTRGHTLEGVFDQARLFHAFARGAPATPILKGEDGFSESYSAFAPEVASRHDGDQPLAAPAPEAERMLARLSETPALVVAGQAASHCVLWSMDDLLTRLDRFRAAGQQVPEVYLLSDCTSPVAVPDGQGGFLADFTDDAAAAMRRWRDAGVHLVDTATPVADWPGAAGDVARAS